MKIEINDDWFRRICNIHPATSIEDSLKIFVKHIGRNTKDQIYHMIGQRCIEQMVENASKERT